MCDLVQYYKVGITSKLNYFLNRVKKKITQSLQIETQKASDKIQYTSMTKILSKHKSHKYILKQATVNFILNGENFSIFPLK